MELFVVVCHAVQHARERRLCDGGGGVKAG